MGNGHSIFARTPQEHLEYMWTHYIPLPHSAPPGHVRVYLLPEWTPGQSPLSEPWAALKADFALDPTTGELDLRKVKGKWALEQCMAIDLERMRPFEGTCEGRLSRLALNVLGDEKGSVWMYEPTPSKYIISMRKDRLHIVRQYDAIVECILEGTLGRFFNLFAYKGVTGESVSRCIYQGSDDRPRPCDVPREVTGEKVLVKKHISEADINQARKTIVRELTFVVSLLFLFISGALGRYAQIGRQLALGW